MKIVPSKHRSARQNRETLEDASNRANQSPAKVADKAPLRTDEPQKQTGDQTLQSFEEYVKFSRGISNVPPGLKKRLTAVSGSAEQSRAKSTTATRASSSKKRKAETSLEDEIAAYKQNLDEAISPDTFENDPLPSCQAVRNRIHKLLDAGIMTKTEFSKAIGSGTNSLSSFLRQTGTSGGRNSSVYYNAWAWFRQREVAKLKMPDPKKRRTQEARAVSSDTGGSTSRTTNIPELPDLSHIHLPGEEADSVSIYDTCDEIRKKINAHLRTPGVTQAQFCRDLYTQLYAPKIKGIQSKQLSDFLQAKGPRTGAKSTVFYAAYVYFEKLRIAQGKPKSRHREEMEDIWCHRGGFDRKTDNRSSFLGSAHTQIHFDRYGRTALF
ncbi:hypothetical protein F5Y06DRAFT_288958 [Hypoxylon sp. FL0890]|nr:hypothetical protein F5Y06DRAFT_288958 [Hypoxylon sp. FL0890]